jgi:hypothetical protein
MRSENTMDDVDDDRVPPGESREEIISRVNEEQRDIKEATGSTAARDVSTRRRLGTRGILHGAGGAVVGAAIGALIGIWEWNLWIVISLAVVGFVLPWLVTAERDDGVVARRMDENLDRDKAIVTDDAGRSGPRRADR